MKVLTAVLCFASAVALAFAQDNKKTNTAAPDPAVLRAIENGHVAYLAAMRANDANALGGLLAADAVYYPPHGAPVAGAEAIRRWYQGIIDQMRTTAIAVSDRNVTVSGDRVIEEGQFVWSVMPAGGRVVEDRGRFLAIWRRQSDGAWKVVRNIWNSSLPSPAASPNAATDGLLSGSWVLNVAKSRFSPGPGPKSETRTYSILPDGRQRAVYDNVDAEGQRHRGESTFRLDGQDVPIVGVPDSDTQAITRTGPRSLAAVIKKDGKVVRNATRVLSEDGRTLTLTFKGVNAKGQPLDDVWVFERADAMTSSRNANELFTLRFTTVRPDKVEEFERLQKEEVIPALKKGGVTARYASSNAMFGYDYVYAFGSPLARYAELDEASAFEKALGPTGASALLKKLRDCHVTTQLMGMRTIADLSWENPSPMAMFVVTNYELAPGRKAEWLQYMREHHVPAVRQAGFKQFFVQETIYGGNADLVYTLTWFDHYADLDQGGLRRRLGDDAYNQLIAKLPAGVVTRTERYVVRARPELSILPPPKTKPTE